MAKQAKKFNKVIHDLEKVVGPVIVRPPRGDDDPETSALFVVIFGRPSGSTQHQVLGRGELVKDNLVLADLDVVDALKDDATPTSVGIAWVSGTTPHTQTRSVGNFGHRETKDASGEDMWMIELATPSTAPLHSALPEGASPASAWCILFPWLTMCQSKN